jgi:hypothetical protein
MSEFGNTSLEAFSVTVSLNAGLLRQLRNTLCDQAAATLTAMRHEMKELKSAKNEVEEATKTKAKTT